MIERSKRSQAPPLWAACGVLVVIAAASSSCRTDHRMAPAHERQRAEFARITLDGNTDDWPTGSIAVADEDYLYVRI